MCSHKDLTYQTQPVRRIKVKVETNESRMLDNYQRRYCKHVARKILTQLRLRGKLLVHADSGPRQGGTRLTDDRHLYLITRIRLPLLESI